MRISKTATIVLIAIVAVVFIAAGVWVGISFAGNHESASGSASVSPYSAVYLSTGDVYFGKLDWFPSPHIENAWFLERGTDAKGNPTVGVYPFSQIAWGPAGDVYFSSNQIIFWTHLANTSSIAQALANPNAAAQSAAQQQAAAGQQVPAPTTSATNTSPVAP